MIEQLIKKKEFREQIGDLPGAEMYQAKIDRYLAMLCYKCHANFRYGYHELCKNCIEGNKRR